MMAKYSILLLITLFSVCHGSRPEPRALMSCVATATSTATTYSKDAVSKSVSEAFAECKSCSEECNTRVKSKAEVRLRV